MCIIHFNHLTGRVGWIKVNNPISNDLVDLVEKNQNNEEYVKILSKMADYALYHVKKEETYMEKLGYPKLVEHRQYHTDFFEKVATYNYDLLSNNPPEPEETFKFLINWLIKHILKADLDYEKHKKNIHSDAGY